MSIRTLTLAASILAVTAAQPVLAANPKGECNSEEKQELTENAPDKTTGTSDLTVTGSTPKGDNKDQQMAAVDRKDPTEITREIVENMKPGKDGAKVAETGPAKPTENWFGCPPEKTPEDKKPQ